MSDRDDGDADTELKPCPFCGGVAEVFYSSGMKLHAPFFYIKCDGCGAASIDCARKADAETAWNARA